MGAQKQSTREAWEVYRHILGQGPVTFADEPPRLEEALAKMCRGRRSSRNFWTDAYLASFATSASMKLATFDRGFRKFSELELILLA